MPIPPKSAGGTDRQPLWISAGETAQVIVIGAALGILVTLRGQAS
jgi:putative ABC transport system permease protein